MMKPCLGTGGMAGVDEVCPQTSGKVSCSQDEALSPVVFAAVPASYKKTHEYGVRTTLMFQQNKQQRLYNIAYILDNYDVPIKKFNKCVYMTVLLMSMTTHAFNIINVESEIKQDAS